MAVRPGQPLAVPLIPRLLLSDATVLRPSADFVSSSDQVTVTATASATPHTVGSWQVLIASAAADYDGLVLKVGSVNTSGTNTAILMDIGTGGAGVEVARVPGIDTGYNLMSGSHPNLITVFMAIRKGDRVVARIQGTVVSETQTITLAHALEPHPTHPLRPAVADAYGVNLSTSVGTSLTNVASANVKSQWTVIGTTTRPYRALMCCVGHQGITNQTGANCVVDFGIGSDGQEQVICENMAVVTSGSENIQGDRWRTVARHVAAGSRVVARYARSGSTSITGSFIGIPY